MVHLIALVFAAPSPRRSAGLASIFADEADQFALNAHPVGTENPGLVGWIGRLERDRCAAPAQPLQSRFFIVDEGDHDFARLGGFLFVMTTVSPSKMPASIIESPRTSSA